MCWKSVKFCTKCVLTYGIGKTNGKYLTENWSLKFLHLQSVYLRYIFFCFRSECVLFSACQHMIRWKGARKSSHRSHIINLNWCFFFESFMRLDHCHKGWILCHCRLQMNTHSTECQRNKNSCRINAYAVCCYMNLYEKYGKRFINFP